MLVLGIETSCDETGLALYGSGEGLIGHKLYSQVAMHAEYGGVVPELASRSHVQKLTPLLRQLLQETGRSQQDIAAVAYTAGPGLMGALLTGAAFGRSLAWALDVPAIGVHHMEGHLLAPLLESPAPEFPFVALLVSGGHTMLVQVNALGEYHLLGESLDDAAGEAFDKTAQILDLGYPGGPALARLAQQGRAGQFRFPRPMLNRKNLDFSFSGLKTHALNTVNKASQEGRIEDPQVKADIAYAFEEAVVEVLSVKSMRALQQTDIASLVVAGGVGANLRLRKTLSDLASEKGFEVYYPRIEFCTDNGAMIAYAGYLRLLAGQTNDLKISARARWPIGELLSA